MNYDSIHERHPYYILGSTIRTLVVGSFIFIVAFAWSEVAKLSFQLYGCHEDDILFDNSKSFSALIKYAIIVTILAILFSFLVMYYIPGTKW
jgi:hypothetical protein